MIKERFFLPLRIFSIGKIFREIHVDFFSYLIWRKIQIRNVISDLGLFAFNLNQGCVFLVFLPGLRLADKWKSEAEYRGCKCEDTVHGRSTRDIKLNREAAGSLSTEGLGSPGSGPQEEPGLTAQRLEANHRGC